jgi:hypothetical protein
MRRDLTAAKRQRRGRIVIPANCHPIVRRLFSEANARNLSARGISVLAGMGRNTIADWGTRKAPSLPNLEAALNALGLRLYVGDDRATESTQATVGD